MNCKKIGLLSHTSNIGGAEKMLVSLGKMLENIGCEVCVIAPNKGKLYDMCLKNGISYEAIENIPLYIFSKKRMDAEFSHDTIVCANYLEKILKELDIELIIVNTLTNFVGTIAAYECNIPVITWVHGVLDPYLLGTESDANKRLLFDKTVLSLSDAVVYCSEWTENFYKNFCVNNNSYVINNWTDLNFNKSNVIENRVVCLNSIEKNKGINEAVDAILLLKKNGIQVQLDIYGKNGTIFEEEIEEKIRRLDLTNNVFIHDKEEDISKIYNNAKVLIQPSYIESFGLTIIEAMAAKTLVISTKCGGPEYIIEDKKNGLLINKCSSFELAEAIEYAFNNPEEVENIIQEAYCDYLNKYDGTAAIKKWNEIIDDIYINQHKKNSIVADLLSLLLKETGGLQGDEIIFEQSKMIDPNNIATSEIINHRAVFRVSPYEGRYNSINIIFTQMSKVEKTGSMKVILLINDKEIHNTMLEMESVVNNEWTTIFVNDFEVTKKDKIQLVFEYYGDNEFVVYVWKRINIFKKILIKSHIIQDKIYAILN